MLAMRETKPKTTLGDLVLSTESNLGVYLNSLESPLIVVGQCLNISGNLTLSFPGTLPSKSIPVANAKCVNGAFSHVTLNAAGASSCEYKRDYGEKFNNGILTISIFLDSCLLQSSAPSSQSPLSYILFHVALAFCYHLLQYHLERQI